MEDVWKVTDDWKAKDSIIDLSDVNHCHFCGELSGVDNPPGLTWVPCECHGGLHGTHTACHKATSGHHPQCKGAESGCKAVTK